MDQLIDVKQIGSDEQTTQIGALFENCLSHQLNTMQEFRRSP